VLALLAAPHTEAVLHNLVVGGRLADSEDIVEADHSLVVEARNHHKWAEVDTGAVPVAGRNNLCLFETGRLVAVRRD
jgi:hypothetical protein